MSGFSFEADWSSNELAHAVEELSEGKLPGRLGLLQQIVGHWAISSDDRNIFQYGKATLDSLGSIMSYREKQKKVVDGGKDASVVWLADNGYEEAFPGAGYSFVSFVHGCLSSLDFNKQAIRDKFGKPSASVLLGFEIAQDKVAYYIDLKGNSASNQSGSSSKLSWDGPYIKDGDYDDLIEFVRNHLWAQMNTKALLFACEQSYSADRIRLSAISDAFDFCSGKEVHNDVSQLAQRCKAFIDTGRCRNLLFYGPPGTGKSTLSRAIARELDKRVVIVEHDAIKYMSGSAYRIIGLLRPGVLVLNDIDRGSRDDNVSLLQALEREHQDHPLLSCLTVNDIGQLDPALLRPGRVHETREIPEPNSESRLLILRFYIEKFGLELSEDEITSFMSGTDGFAPADIKEFCETALAVGVNIALQEIARINDQRKLYAGSKCQEFNDNKVGVMDNIGSF